jgi:hypothetical protein
MILYSVAIKENHKKLSIVLYKEFEHYVVQTH